MNLLALDTSTEAPISVSRGKIEVHGIEHTKRGNGHASTTLS